MKKKQQNQQPSMAIKAAIAWYTPEQWQRLQEIAVDKDSLHDTYGDWLVDATAQTANLNRLGISAELIQIDVEELHNWCLQQLRPVDGAARAEFVSNKARLGA